uniref:Uncharacterized protein n=1 Tax=Anopheles merus TaxID=30066 RepID=A0A182UXZ7_ANOME
MNKKLIANAISTTNTANYTNVACRTATTTTTSVAATASLAIRCGTVVLVHDHDDVVVLFVLLHLDVAVVFVAPNATTRPDDTTTAIAAAIGDGTGCRPSHHGGRNGPNVALVATVQQQFALLVRLLIVLVVVVVVIVVLHLPARFAIPTVDLLHCVQVVVALVRPVDAVVDFRLVVLGRHRAIVVVTVRPQDHHLFFCRFAGSEVGLLHHDQLIVDDLNSCTSSAIQFMVFYSAGSTVLLMLLSGRHLVQLIIGTIFNEQLLFRLLIIISRLYGR